MKILVTGGAGYIGSHTVKELIKAGHEVVVLDNLSTGNREAVIKPAKLVEADINDKDIILDIFRKNSFDAVLHFAALKNAAVSVKKVKEYYRTNIGGSLNILEAMVENGVKKIIFSSSAAVYGDVSKIPITEISPTVPNNPYGKTKLIFEEILKDYDNAYGIKSVSLRYFNAGGADIEGELGNDNPERDDLLSILINIAVSNKPEFIINGLDYETKDGSPVRDLVHVTDLADAHVKALKFLEEEKKSVIVNLGSENGFTVLETANLVKEIANKTFETVKGPRRQGDIAVSVASSKKAKELFAWEPKYSDLNTIVRTAWEWESKDSRMSKRKSVLETKGNLQL